MKKSEPMKDGYDFSTAERDKFFRKGARLLPPVHMEPGPMNKPPIDFDKFWARLDALGARDFLPEGIPDEAPPEPDPRKFFD
jgi:hypothetical protein